MTVTPGSVLNIYVGGAGIQGNSNGGYNGVVIVVIIPIQEVEAEQVIFG
ncbi:MAG: hypothetical protein IPI22_11205 [Bacteroidetes bacterium]|nr:hypothetical protein [Bacteroidota bacterium]